jgi:hypothetical protein
MKRLFVPFLAVATLFLLSSSAYAQHGRPSGTPGGMGQGASQSQGSAHSPNAGGGNAGATNSGSKTPDQLLTQNSKLSDNLGKLLPTGVTPQQACQNFKNLGQCVAAIHVSHNLGIDLNSLACDMTMKPVGTGTCANTPSKGMSLGASIDALKPGTNGKTEAQTAMKQAKQTLKESGS